MTAKKVKPNLLSWIPNNCKSETNFGTTGTNCDKITVIITLLTMEIMVQDGVKLLESSIFCVRKSLILASRLKTESTIM